MNLLLSTLSAAGLAGLAVSSLRPSAPPASSGAAEYEVDEVHSTVLFHTQHVGVSEAYGRFDRVSEESKIVYDAAAPTKSSILIVIPADSVNTSAPNRDKHLRSADFFNAQEFPEIVFESKTISGQADALVVEGELTFHGVTKKVSAKARVVGEGDTPFNDHRVGFVGEFGVSLADFDIAYAKKSPGVVGPEVAITVSLECVRK